MMTGALAGAPHVETFEGYNATTPSLGTPSMPGTPTAPAWVAAGGPPAVALVNNATLDFPFAPAGHARFLRWKENTSEATRLTWSGSSLPGTATMHQVAFAIRIALDPVVANNDIDIVTVSSASGVQWALIGEGTSGRLRLHESNGWGTTSIIDDRAFDPTWPLNWGDGKWRVVIGRVAAGTALDGTAFFWVMDPDTGTIVQRLDAGANNLRGVAAITSIGFGASVRPAGTSSVCQVDIDQFSIYPTNLYPTEAQFLAAVRADMSGAPPPSFAADVDLDGYSDAYELLRGSSPNDHSDRPLPRLGDIDNNGSVNGADVQALALALVNKTALNVDRAGIVDDNIAGNIADDTIYNAADLTQLANFTSGLSPILR